MTLQENLKRGRRTGPKEQNLQSPTRIQGKPILQTSIFLQTNPW